MSDANNLAVDEEKWADVKGFENLYQVSNFGNVRAKDKYVKYKNGRVSFYSGKPIKLTVNSAGYYSFCAHDNYKVKCFRVHRLVAEAFVPKVDGKNCINHIDANKLNNHYSNLEWCTQEENVHHAINLGLNRESLKNNSSSIPVVKVDTNTGEDLERYPSINEAIRANNLNRAAKSGIILCCKNRHNRKTAFGYSWRYADV